MFFIVLEYGVSGVSPPMFMTLVRWSSPGTFSLLHPHSRPRIPPRLLRHDLGEWIEANVTSSTTFPEIEFPTLSRQRFSARSPGSPESRHIEETGEIEKEKAVFFFFEMFS